MGILFLPSLTEKKFIEINNVTLEEASGFMKDFTKHVAEGHKIKSAGNATVEPIVFNNILDYSDLDFEEIEEISEIIRIADTPGTRGARAIFVEEDGNFAVGTTVIYNRNWATINFDDDSIIDSLRAAGLALTLEVEEDESDDNDELFWYQRF